MHNECWLPSSTATVPVGWPNGGTVAAVAVAVVKVPTVVGLGVTDTSVTVVATAGATVYDSGFDIALEYLASPL